MKTYKITVKNGWMSKLKEELVAWGVAQDKYRVDGDVLITSNNNVIDVATETFIENLHLISIESISFAKDVPNDN